MQPLATAKLWESGSRAAIQIGGMGFWIGRGEEVETGNFQISPSWATSPCHRALTSGTISRRAWPPLVAGMPPAMRSNSYW
ncbi:hypothetical protein FQZ97_1070310 [compost metagenome]